MVATPSQQAAEVVYPSSDGAPLAETSVHIDAIINAVVVLRQYLEGQQAIVLADQFLYYAQGYPKLRVAPDIMVIRDVAPGPRDNYKIWEEGAVPSVVFEITSEGTQHYDLEHKKNLYEQLEVKEYWLFDPKSEWIPHKLKGFRLIEGMYLSITNGRSEPLQLRLEVEDALIAFYRENTGEKLYAPDDLVQALQNEVQARQQAEQRAEQERQRAEQERQRAEIAEARLGELEEKLRSHGIDPNDP